MSENKIEEYSNGEITVVWNAEKCIHAGECVKRLPKVYNVDKTPWIDVTQATTEELKSQVSACPSGALTFVTNDSK